MRFLSLFLSILLVGIQHVLADSHIWPLPQLPSNDSFYHPPDGESWKKLPLGSILKVRSVSISSLLPFAVSKAKAYQLLYSTQDVHGERDASVTTVIIPVKPNLNRVLSVQNAYDSADINCSPSYGLQYQAEGWSSLWNKINLAFVMPYLQQGPILNIPDYEGSNAAFTVGPQSAYQTLDSIRAVVNSTEHTGVSPDANVVMFGYSGGAFATEWATEKKAWYAPDLPIVGAAMGGPPPNVTQTYHNVNKKDLAELNIAAMLGVMNAYPDMDEWMRGELKTDDDGDKRFLFLRGKCSDWCKKLSRPFAGEDVSSLFKSGDYFLTKYRDRLTEIGVMGRNISWINRPKYRLMFFYGDKDEVTSPVKDSDDLVAKWSRVAFVKKHKLPNETHTSALLPGLPKAWVWINRTFKRVEKAASLGENIDEDEFGLDETTEDPGLDTDESIIQAQMLLGAGDMYQDRLEL